MRRHIFTALFNALTATSVVAGSVAVSDPVGFTRQKIETGQQTVGITLNNPAIFSATITANSAEALMLATAGRDIGSLLNPAAAYYVEIVGGSSEVFIGDRFEIDVALTREIEGAFLALTNASHNSAPLPLPIDQLRGYRVSIKQHVTIGEVFGTGNDSPLRSAARFADADQIQMFDNTTGSFVSYFLHADADGAEKSWRQLGHAGDMADRIIPPGTGVFVRRLNGPALDLVQLGSVRTNDFVMPLASGYNLIASPYPTESTPIGLQMTSDNGFLGAAASTEADRILVFNGSDYDTYFLEQSPGSLGEVWRRDGDNTMSYSTSDLLTAFNSVFIYKVAADPNFIARHTPAWRS